MEINDFSSLIELSASLSLAFVAIEYARSFSVEVCKRMFDIDSFIDKSFGVLRQAKEKRDKTLDSLTPVPLANGKSTNAIIESLKRSNEKLSEKTEKEKESIEIDCQVESMSVLFFFYFLMDILLLVFGGFKLETSWFCLVFCVFVILYSAAGWVLGEDDSRLSKILNYKSIKQPIFIVAIIVFAAICYFGVLKIEISEGGILDKINNFVLFFTIIIPYFNFIFYIYQIRIQALNLLKDIGEKVNVLLNESKTIDTEIDELVTASKVIGVALSSE